MVYLDTSFVAPLILREAESGAVEGFVATLPAGVLAVSHWTLIEFASLLARLARMRALNETGLRKASRQFETMIQQSFIVLLPAPKDFMLARDFVANPATGLRGGDALHLAVASNAGIETIYSLDRIFLKAAGLLGLNASRGIGVEP